MYLAESFLSLFLYPALAMGRTPFENKTCSEMHYFSLTPPFLPTPFLSGFFPSRYGYNAHSEHGHCVTSVCWNPEHCRHFNLIAFIGVNCFTSRPFLHNAVCVIAIALIFLRETSNRKIETPFLTNQELLEI